MHHWEKIECNVNRKNFVFIFNYSPTSFTVIALKKVLHSSEKFQNLDFINQQVYISNDSGSGYNTIFINVTITNFLRFWSNSYKMIDKLFFN